jgi:GNAT superfamily N-acetyltransferase
VALDWTMKEVSISERVRLAPLFEGYKWNYLPDAILEGTMGRALADDDAELKVAVLEAPRLKLSIPAGDPQHPLAQAYLDALRGPWALVLASPGWQELAVRRHAGKLVTTQRFAFTSERLDAGRLRELGSRVPGGYRLERMDLTLARKLAGERSEFSADHLLAFASPEEFLERGFGFCLLAGDQIVSAATTFAVCRRGIEIQINTREKHQHRGLATAVAAHLLLHSLRLGLDPNWDAANRASVCLAQKLGYTPQGNYPLVLFAGSRLMAAVTRLGLKVKELVGK